jgi:outer membrane protein assembly factor BamD
MRVLLFLNLSIILFLVSCSTKKPEGKTEAEVLYKEANSYIEDERYLLATERLNLLRSQYPYSYYSTHAELLQADILFLQESFVEAAAAYSVFRDYHPKHEKMAYVIWKLGESYFNQLPSTFDRDLSPAQDAIKVYNELAQKYPSYERLDQIKERIQTSENLLKQKDQYIADFYFKTKVFDAARFRYLFILKQYQKDEELSNYSMRRIVESSYRLKEFDECLKHSKTFSEKVSAEEKAFFVNFSKNCNEEYRIQEKKNAN